MTLTKFILNLIWAVILILFTLTGCSPASEDLTPTPLPPLEIVQPAEYVVETGTVQRTLTFNGRIAPVLSQPLFFEDDGVVTGVLVQQGDTVSAGDLIAHLAIADLEHQLVTAELTLQMAELQTNTAERVAAEIALNQAVTEEARRLAEAQLADAQNRAQAYALEIQLLQEEVNRLKDEIARRQLLAPFDGLLLALNVRPGDTVEAFDPVATLADPAQLEVTAEVSPAMASVLGVGQTVSVTIPTRGLNFNAVIRQLPAALDGDNLVRIAVPETAGLTTGELATVFVILEERQDVLTLPPAAIRTFQGRTFVIVVEPDGSRRRFDVLLGLQSEARVEVLEGVAEGQIVIGE